MSEKELRAEAVRRRLAGESSEEIAADLGRTTRWVRKWVARHVEDGHDTNWATGRSQAPDSSPNQTPDTLRDQILNARRRLEANPRARYIRSNRKLALFGKHITLSENQTHQYVTTIIKVRAKRVIVVTLDGEIIHDGAYDIARTLQ